MPCTRALFVALCRVVRAAHSNTLVIFLQDIKACNYFFQLAS